MPQGTTEFDPGTYLRDLGQDSLHKTRHVRREFKANDNFADGKGHGKAVKHGPIATQDVIERLSATAGKVQGNVATVRLRRLIASQRHRWPHELWRIGAIGVNRYCYTNSVR